MVVEAVSRKRFPEKLWRETEGFVRRQNPKRHYTSLAALFFVRLVRQRRERADRDIHLNRVALPGRFRAHDLIALYRPVIAAGSPIGREVAQPVTRRGLPQFVRLTRVTGGQGIKKASSRFFLGVIAKGEPKHDH